MTTRSVLRRVSKRRARFAASLALAALVLSPAAFAHDQRDARDRELVVAAAVVPIPIETRADSHALVPPPTPVAPAPAASSLPLPPVAVPLLAIAMIVAGVLAGRKHNRG